MKLDEIGKTIQNEELLDAIGNLKFSINQTYLVVDENGNPVNDVGTVIDETQYIHTSNNLIQLSQSYTYEMRSLKKECSLQLMFLKDQLAEKHFYLWPIAANVHTGSSVTIQFPEQLFLELYRRKFRQYKISYKDFRNHVYLKVAQGFELIQPLLTYIMGTSLFLLDNLDKRAKRSSLTLSLLSTVDNIYPDFSTLERYIDTNQATGKVTLEYDSEDNPQITMLKLDHLDFDPNSDLSIGSNVVSLINILAGYFLMNTGVSNDELVDKIVDARKRDLKVAGSNPFRKIGEIQKYKAFLDDIKRFAAQFNYDDNIALMVDFFKDELDDVMKTPAAQLLRHQGNQSLFDLICNYSVKRNEKIKMGSISDNSVRILRAAFRCGIDYRVIDENQDIIQISNHYIYDGLHSDLDAAVLSKMWDNKELTKQLLGNLNIQFQRSWKVTTTNQASKIYPIIKNRAVVIKNAFGHTDQTGMLYRLTPNRKSFMEDVDLMLKRFQSILIEQVTTGSAYQAMILNGKVVSLIERVPENVVGDGRKNLGQLVKQKQLFLGRNEKKTIEMQGISNKSIIQRGIQVLLRYDAFTGSHFQSVDALNDADCSYIELIEKIAQRLNMRNGFIDMLLDNIYQPYVPEHPELAVFLSAHANADLKPHEEMALGKHRNIALRIVESYK